jgi:Outer membrane protein beta-barrel domain
MKKIKSVLAALAMLACAGYSQAQSTNETSMDKILELAGGAITNISVDPYATYAPKAPDKFGGGFFAAYNINENVGLGIGLDWLGSFSLVSGNVTLRAPFHITTVFPQLAQYKLFQDLIVTPFAIAGVATPYSGNGNFNGTPFVVSDIGAYVKFGHVLGGQFDAGGAYGKWSGQGPYGGVTRYHFFAGLCWGF